MSREQLTFSSYSAHAIPILPRAFTPQSPLMAPDEYSAGGGGKLKLKGNKVSNGRVEKKKKKKGGKKDEAQAGITESGSEAKDQGGQSGRASAEPEKGGGSETHELGPGSAAKTEAERRYEEVRRKRVCSSRLVGRGYEFGVDGYYSYRIAFSGRGSRRIRSVWKN